MGAALALTIAGCGSPAKSVRTTPPVSKPTVVGLWKGDILNPANDGFNAMVYAARVDVRADHTFEVYWDMPESGRTSLGRGTWSQKGDKLIVKDGAETDIFTVDLAGGGTIFMSSRHGNGPIQVLRKAKRSRQAQEFEYASAIATGAKILSKAGIKTR